MACAAFVGRSGWTWRTSRGFPSKSGRAQARRDDLLALGAALVTVGFWASAFVGIRDAGEELSPGGLALARLAVGSAVLAVFVVARRERRPERRDLPALALCGVLWFGLYNIALNAGEQRVDAGTAAMLVGVGPVLIILLAGVVLSEGFPRSLVVGCALAFAGVLVIAFADSERGGSALGAALCVAAAVAYAGGVVSQKPVLARVSPLQATFVCCLVGTLVCLPFAPTARRGGGRRRSWGTHVGRLPRRLSDGARVHHLGVRARAHERRPARHDHLPRPAALDSPRLGLPRRGAGRARLPRRSALPGRRGGGPEPPGSQLARACRATLTEE